MINVFNFRLGKKKKKQLVLSPSPDLPSQPKKKSKDKSETYDINWLNGRPDRKVNNWQVVI